MGKAPINKWPENLVDKLTYQFNSPWADIKTNFFRLMAVAQESWLGVRESLSSILSAETNKTMRRIILSILADVNEWQSLWYAFWCHPYFFSPDEIELINASEKMWNVPETLKDVASELESNQKINDKIQKAIMYPIWLLIFACIAVAVLLIFVIPTITELYEWSDAPLPAITTFMINASDFMRTMRWLLILIIGWFIITFQIVYSTVIDFKKFIDLMLLKIPNVSAVVKTFYMYKFSKLLGDFWKAWVGPIESLNQMMKIFDNYHYKRKMLTMKNDLSSWFTISDSIEWSDLFDPILIQIIMVWEKTGNLSPILLTMSAFYRYQLGGKIDTMVSMIEPAMMALIAGMIWSIVAAIFLPLAGLMDAVGGS